MNILILTKPLYTCKPKYNIDKMDKPRIIRNVTEHNDQYKITIPKEIALKMGLQNKDAIEIKEKDGIITIEKI